MVEINSEDQNKVKRMKRTENSLRDHRDNIKCINIQIIGIPGEREKKGLRKFLRDYIQKCSQHQKGSSQSSPRSSESPIDDKHKDKHAETHTNQTKKYQTQGKNIKSSKGKATSNIQGKLHTINSWSFIRNSADQKGIAGYI